MKQQLAEIAQDRRQPRAAPTFDNTIEAMERSGELLTRVSRSLLQPGRRPTPTTTLQKIQAEIAPKLAAHQDAIYLEPEALRAREGDLRPARHARARSRAEAPGRALLPATSCAPARSCPTPTRTTLRELNEEESKLTTEFHNKLLADTQRRGACVVDDKARARRPDRRRHRRGRGGGQGAQARRQVGAGAAEHHAAAGAGLARRTARCASGCSKASIDARRARRRQRHARRSSSAWRSCAPSRPSCSASRTTPPTASTTRWPRRRENALEAADRPRARRHRQGARRSGARCRQLIDAAEGRLQARPLGLGLLRRAGAQGRVRPRRIADQAVLRARPRAAETACSSPPTQLYGITFKERKDIPVYHPDVRVFDVFDADGSSLALFYADYFKRDSKRGGAWMDSFVEPGRPDSAPSRWSPTSATSPSPPPASRRC